MYHIGYFMRVLIAVDQVLNTLLGGYPDETLSSRTYRLANLIEDPKWYWVLFNHFVDALFLFQNEHCEQSYLVELQLNPIDPTFKSR